MWSLMRTLALFLLLIGPTKLISPCGMFCVHEILCMQIFSGTIITNNTSFSWFTPLFCPFYSPLAGFSISSMLDTSSDRSPKPELVIPLCLLVFLGLPMVVSVIYWYKNYGCTCPRVVGVSMIPTESGLYKPFDRGVGACVRQCCRWVLLCFKCFAGLVSVWNEPCFHLWILLLVGKSTEGKPLWWEDAIHNVLFCPYCQLWHSPRWYFSSLLEKTLIDMLCEGGENSTQVVVCVCSDI